MILPILTEPNPLLHQKCGKIKVFDEKLKQLAQNMVETLFANKGIGLAAPQIGKKIKLIVIEFDPARIYSNEELEKTVVEKNKIPLTVLVNPTITKLFRETAVDKEGCLSLPKMELDVKRSKNVSVLAQNLQGSRIKIRAKGLFSRILQHEIDHLSGIMITDKKTI